MDEARKAVHDVDETDSPINAIVSVLMLREGWDVKNVMVVVGLRPYTAKANILLCHVGIVPVYFTLESAPLPQLLPHLNVGGFYDFRFSFATVK